MTSSRRGYVVISDEGKKYLSNNPSDLTQDDLSKIPAFIEFKNRKKKKIKLENEEIPNSLINIPSQTPEDRIQDAIDEISHEISLELISRVLAAPPAFFEHLIIKLLMSMGYGGSNKNAGRTLGKTGDNGVDGVIDQDPLGLDRVYIQAKRYDPNNKISSEQIRGFAGSLQLHQANKGLFVTTSEFTAAAKETAEKINQRIVLIDGEKLTELMLQYNIGSRNDSVFYIKKIDEDFFEY